MEALKELEFIDQIEDNFPVENYLHSIKLIDEAITISPNCVFAVVEEICKKAGEDVVHEETLVNLLKHIDKKFEHPLRKMILEAAQDIIFEDEVAFDTVAANMESVREFKGQYAALNILFFSTEDVDGKLEKLWDNITTEWNDGQSLFDDDDEEEEIEEDEDND